MYWNIILNNWKNERVIKGVRENFVKSAINYFKHTKIWNINNTKRGTCIFMNLHR